MDDPTKTFEFALGGILYFSAGKVTTTDCALLAFVMLLFLMRIEPPWVYESFWL